MDFGGPNNKVNETDALKKTTKRPVNGDNLAIVPNNRLPFSASSDKPVKIIIDQYPMSNMSDSNTSFSLHDVNSTTNLIGMDGSANVTPNQSTSNFMTTVGNKVYSDRLGVALNGQLNNSESQSSMETTITTTRLKLDDDVDMIPLMPLNNNQTSIPVNDVSDLEKEPMKHLASEEKWYVVLLQVLFPFFIAGFGMVGAGVVLDITQHWTLFKEVPAIFTLIPALLGLKGNLEMTLASRFSTQVNLGKIRDKSTILSAVLGNIALTQAQAIIVGFLASVGAIILKAISEKKFDLDRALVLVAGSVSTASFASLILAGLMMFVILLSKKFRINPDNVATPLAASLGDLVTLSILSVLCTILYTIRSMIGIPIIIILLFVLMVPIFIFYSCKNDFVKEALHHGWVPIILAMVISSTGGVIMGLAVNDYSDIAVFQPVVNGVGGNLVAIFASRLSTALHKTGTQGTQAFWAPKKWYLYPIQTFVSKSNPEAKTAAILAFLAIPGHTIFFFTIEQIKKLQHDPINPATQSGAFISFYLGISTLQVLILLLICYWMVHLAWRLDTNPDNVCIPYLTAIGDLLGMFFLAICFHVLYLSGLTGLKRPS